MLVSKAAVSTSVSTVSKAPRRWQWFPKQVFPTVGVSNGVTMETGGPGVRSGAQFACQFGMPDDQAQQAGNGTGGRKAALLPIA